MKRVQIGVFLPEDENEQSQKPKENGNIIHRL